MTKQRVNLWLKVGVLFAVVLVARMGDSVNVTAALAESPRPASCIAPEYRQFDFWVGDWDVFDFAGSAKVAHVRVDRVLDGCAVREQYEDTNGKKGQSLSIYDASRNTWHQSWFTNRGELLGIEGKFQSGEMVLSGMDRTSTGEPRLVRGSWKLTDAGVRETALTSTDDGKTWKPWFDLIFRPAATAGDEHNASASGEEKTIAALDTEYQAAVQKNDAVAMDRLLAENFILVTGSGKTYSKADLLDEARSGRVSFERQEDQGQTVRVWSDTAVVTAKLWAKGSENGKPFEYTLWFSDTYVRTPAGWRYVFGQSSLPLPKTTQ